MTDRLPNRRIAIVPHGRPLQCPYGHRIREDDIVLEHAGIRCKHKPAAGQGECGAFLWVLMLIPSGMRFVVEVTLDELRHMQTAGLSAEQSLTFLGVTGPLRTDN